MSKSVDPEGFKSKTVGPKQPSKCQVRPDRPKVGADVEFGTLEYNRIEAERIAQMYRIQVKLKRCRGALEEEKAITAVVQERLCFLDCRMWLKT